MVVELGLIVDLYSFYHKNIDIKRQGNLRSIQGQKHEI